MKAIILAAGKSTRLHPTTTFRPKPLIEIAGIPILDRIIHSVKAIGINEIIVVTHFQKNKIEDHLRKKFTDVKTVYQKEPIGTGDAIVTGLKNTETDVLVLNGDIVFPPQFLKKAYRQFQDESFLSLISGASVEHTTKYGVLITEGNLVKGVVEKPKNVGSVKNSKLINAGIYFFRKKVLHYFKNIEKSSRGEFEITTIINKLAKEKIAQSFAIIKDGWFDVGYPWDLLESNAYLLHKEKENFHILGNIEENVTIHNKAFIGEHTKVKSGVYIEGPVYIDTGAVIGPNCYIRAGTYIGKNVKIGNACEIKNSIIYHDTTIGHLSYVGDSIIGEKCNFGAGTKTANLRHDRKTVKVTIKNERLDSGRKKLGVIMGDKVNIGINASLMPGIKIVGGKNLDAGKVFKKDIV